MDELGGNGAAQGNCAGDRNSLSAEPWEELIRLGADENSILPEISTCHHGLHQGTEHHSTLTVQPHAFAVGTALYPGLPYHCGPCPANELAFHQKARLTTLHPFASAQTTAMNRNGEG